MRDLENSGPAIEPAWQSWLAGLFLAVFVGVVIIMSLAG